MLTKNAILKAISQAYRGIASAVHAYIAGPLMDAADPNQDAPHPVDQPLRKALEVVVDGETFYIVVVGHCSLSVLARRAGTAWGEIASLSDH